MEPNEQELKALQQVYDRTMLGRGAPPISDDMTKRLMDLGLIEGLLGGLKVTRKGRQALGE